VAASTEYAAGNQLLQANALKHGGVASQFSNNSTAGSAEELARALRDRAGGGWRVSAGPSRRRNSENAAIALVLQRRILVLFLSATVPRPSALAPIFEA